MLIRKHRATKEQELFKKNGYINPDEFQKGIYKKMDAFFCEHIDNNLQADLAIQTIKWKMAEVFQPKYILWFFSLYEEFPEWTPLHGWDALGRTLLNQRIKNELND